MNREEELELKQKALECAVDLCSYGEHPDKYVVLSVAKLFYEWLLERPNEQ